MQKRTAAHPAAVRGVWGRRVTGVVVSRRSYGVGEGPGLKTRAGDVAKAALDEGISCPRPDHAFPGSYRQRV
nr:hypothetical protein [uncultured Rhodopila sp.]